MATGAPCGWHPGLRLTSVAPRLFRRWLPPPGTGRQGHGQKARSPKSRSVRQGGMKRSHPAGTDTEGPREDISRLPPTTECNDIAGPAYSRWAAVFVEVHSETHSVAVALEILDTLRERERLRPRFKEEPKRIVEMAASLFHVPAKALHDRDRRRDVISARYVAAWLLRRRRWSYSKIGRFFGLDHSTIMNGLRKVARTNHLINAATKAEQLLHSDATHRAPEGPSEPAARLQACGAEPSLTPIPHATFDDEKHR